VAGLPDPRPDHVVVMARFARDCYQKVIILTRELERSLGPGMLCTAFTIIHPAAPFSKHTIFSILSTSTADTADLTLRIGLHSGPVSCMPDEPINKDFQRNVSSHTFQRQVTAGVLRGDKGRFQLFGDVSSAQ
jgi:hypothetical protein